MSTLIDTTWQELRRLVADLGKDGGLISPSIYDTAQVLRLYPPTEGVEPGLDWLLAQQRSDGGWGTPDAPYARTVPTLAALLALHCYRKDRKTRIYIDAGLAFLEDQAKIWMELNNIDLLPTATEMILPCLIEQANATGLTIERQSYASVFALRRRKCQQISKRQLIINAPPTYSWEALGHDVHPPLIDHLGSMGHSPSATAAWLHKAEQFSDLAVTCARARQYLVRAAASTLIDIPGVVPHMWPLTGFELSYPFLPLLVTDLLKHPLLQDAMQTPLNQLHKAITQDKGVGLGESFAPDVDITSVSMAVLQATGRYVDPNVVLQFKNDDHFCTFRPELNPSVFSTAHAIYALAELGLRYPSVEEFLLRRQCTDGRWLSDKWHSSWLYTTLELIHTLAGLGYTDEVMMAAGVLVQNQKCDGGWGYGSHSTRLETCYAIIALQMLQKANLLNGPGQQALQGGFNWLCRHYQPNLKIIDEALWIGKELYSPYRLDRIYELSAILVVTQALEFA